MLVAHPMLELQQNVEALELEVEQLVRRRDDRERSVRVPAVEAREQLAAVEARLGEEEGRLARFNAELSTPSRIALTWPRTALLAVSLGAFSFGAAAAPVDLPHAAIALFGGAWVAFLAGALRGK